VRPRRAAGRTAAAILPAPRTLSVSYPAYTSVSYPAYTSVSYPAYTSNSDNCPADWPVFAVKVSRR